MKIKFYTLIVIIINLFNPVELKSQEAFVVNNCTSINFTQMNILYIGVENEIEIKTTEKVTDVMIMGSEYFKVRKTSENTFYIKPEKSGTTQLTVMGKKNDEIIVLETRRVRCLQIPDPIPVIGNKEGGIISKQVLLVYNVLRAEIRHSYFDIRFHIIEFTVNTYNSEGFCISNSSKSSKFTPQQKQQIKQLKRGQKLYIENIKAIGPDKTTRKLPPMVFKIM